MAKLWQKKYKLNEDIEAFTVGKDYVTDKSLVKHDARASIAHAFMLSKIGILTKGEFVRLKDALIEILKMDEGSGFAISQSDEDVHTAIENHLTEKLGDLGKKIHTARSRNDQVLTDIRLYSKESLLNSWKLALELALRLLDAAEKFQWIPMPGYTHSRKAMPSSVGMHLSSFAESILDDAALIEAAYALNDQSPLGSGAGYGLPLDVDRELVAKLLGFKKVQNNNLYVQNSRGKIEAHIVYALSAIMDDLSRLSNDLITFSMDEFGYFSLPEEFCTGSSIMPQKKNPDVFELARAKSAKVNSNLFLLKNITARLPSGYNRDLQLTKEPLIESFEITSSTLRIFCLVLGNLRVNRDKCVEACTQELYATERAYEMVKKGTPFRDAYRQVAETIGDKKDFDPVASIKSSRHSGSTGNLGLEGLEAKVKSMKKELEAEISKHDSAIMKLLRI